MKKLIIIAAFAVLAGTPAALAQQWSPTTTTPTQIHNLDTSGRVMSSGATTNPCASPDAAIQSVTGTTSGTTAVQIIALSGTTKIYICSLTVTGVSGTTPTFSLVYGTGANCATGQAVIIGAWTTAANTIYAFAYPVVITPAGQALCYLDTGTTPVQRFALTYVQQ